MKKSSIQISNGIDQVINLSSPLNILIKKKSNDDDKSDHNKPHLRFFVQRVFRPAFWTRTLCIAGYGFIAHVALDQFRHLITLNNSSKTNTPSKGEHPPIKTHPDDWKKAPIEAQIRPLVDSLRLRGITTVASCAGHSTRPSTPYVLFRCTEAEAWEVQTILHDLYLSDRTHRYWSLDARFSPDGVLQYCLTASSLENLDIGLLDIGLRRLWHFWIRRHRIDHDLQAIASALTPTVASAIPPSNLST